MCLPSFLSLDFIITMKSDGFKKLKGKNKPPPWLYKFSSASKNQNRIGKRLFSKHFGYQKNSLNNFSNKSFPFNFHMTSSGETLYANNLPFKSNLNGQEIGEGFNTLIVDLFITSVKKISKCRSVVTPSLRTRIRNKRFLPARPLLDMDVTGVFTPAEVSTMFRDDKQALDTRNFPIRIAKTKQKLRTIFVSNETLDLAKVKNTRKWKGFKGKLITFEQKLKEDMTCRKNFSPIEIPQGENPFRTVRYDLACKANGFKQTEFSPEIVKTAKEEILRKMRTVILPNDHAGSRYRLFGLIGYVLAIFFLISLVL